MFVSSILSLAHRVISHDILLCFFTDWSLFEEGGDWERKNRLKVYEGLYCMATRNFKKAASLFLDSISTFTTYELFPYDTFIFYTVLTSVITLDRVSLKQKVFNSILSALFPYHNIMISSTRNLTGGRCARNPGRDRQSTSPLWVPQFPIQLPVQVVFCCIL